MIKTRYFVMPTWFSGICSIVLVSGFLIILIYLRDLPEDISVACVFGLIVISTINIIYYSVMSEMDNRIRISFQHFLAIYTINSERIQLRAFPVYVISKNSCGSINEYITFTFGFFNYIRYTLLLYRMHRNKSNIKTKKLYYKALQLMSSDIEHLKDQAEKEIATANNQMQELVKTMKKSV